MVLAIVFGYRPHHVHMTGVQLPAGAYLPATECEVRVNNVLIFVGVSLFPGNEICYLLTLQVDDPQSLAFPDCSAVGGVRLQDPFIHQLT